MAGVGGHSGDERGESPVVERGKNRAEGIDETLRAEIVVPATLSLVACCSYQQSWSSAVGAESLRLLQIMAGLLQKEYIAKVIGVFPEGEQMVDANVIHDPREGRSSVEVCDKDTEKVLKGKAACTRFIRISTDGIHSIVLCKPVTGRTHQIRVHLRHTGHPIANDMLYLPEIVASHSTQGTGADRAATRGTNKLPFEFNDDIHAEVNLMDLDEEFSFDPMCTNCPNLAPKGYDGSEEGLWLHCLRYSGPDWSYDCPYPDWASLS